MELKKRISDILREIGVPAHIKGYKYLREAIIVVIEDPDAIHAISRTLYPAVAKMNATTSSRVERSIRHAVEVAFERGDPDVLKTYFGNTVSAKKGKATNSEAIAAIADMLCLEMNI